MATNLLNTNLLNTNRLDTVPLYVYTIVTQLRNSKQVTFDNAALMALASSLVTIQFIGDDDVTYDDYFDNPSFSMPLEFDFVIGKYNYLDVTLSNKEILKLINGFEVGTGSGGSAMAGRLCEIDKWTVLSIEAGDDPILNSEVPKLFTTLWRSPNDWNYTSPETNACLSQNGGCFLPRGKMVGGCASINVMFFVRGAYPIYDLWKTQYNCSGWGLDDILPYFRKFEGNRQYSDSKYHNTTGPVCINSYPQGPYQDFFARAAAELGYPQIDDYNGPENPYTKPAYCNVQGTQCDGRRSGTAKSYIIPLKKKQNFKLIKNAIVTRILFRGKRAIGVKFVRFGKTYIAYARKEVIVCGGAYATPILLQLSGIGDPNILKKNNIPVVAPSPETGRNLADHVCVDMWYSLPSIQDSMTLPELANNILLYWGNPKTGYFTQISTLPSIGYVNTTVGGLAHIQCIHYIFFKNSMELPEFLRTMYYKDAVNEAIMNANKIGAVALVMPTLLDPSSRGTCLINGTKGVDAFNRPSIKMNYYSDSQNLDRTIMIKAMRDQRARENTKTYQSVGASLIKMPFCFNYDLDSDQFYNCYLDYFSASMWHPSGTCRMGPNPAISVVNDTDCTVYGVKNLRVADMSLSPKLPWGNTNSATLMMSEKCADKIKMDYGETIGVL